MLTYVFAISGVVPADGVARLAVPAAVRARRHVVTVAVGQEGGRLRVRRLRLGPVSYAVEDRSTIMVE